MEKPDPARDSLELRTMQNDLLGPEEQSHLLGHIRNLYWHIRAIRPHQQAKRRKLYRQIAKIKAVLTADGLDSEALRLWCRCYTNCYPEAAQARLRQYLRKCDTQTQKTLAA